MRKSSDPRHQARRIALKSLFEWTFLSRRPEEILLENFERHEEELRTTSQPIRQTQGSPRGFTPRGRQARSIRGTIDKELATSLTCGVIDNLEEIDQTITQSAPEWPISQIDKIDLSILRLAIFELKFAKSTPKKVAIDEAVELGKEFGGENSGKFVNGVLGTVVKEIENV